MHRAGNGPVTHEAQNVHSKVQIIASVESGGRSVSQSSQPGRSSSTAPPQLTEGTDSTLPV